MGGAGRGGPGLGLGQPWLSMIALDAERRDAVGPLVWGPGRPGQGGGMAAGCTRSTPRLLLWRRNGSIRSIRFDSYTLEPCCAERGTAGQVVATAGLGRARIYHGLVLF